ncbi:MAG: magnesium/cobalt transporter CorA [Candidatus Thorarchaeota archaeon]
MPRLFRRRSKAIGLPPGTPVYVGERRPQKTKISIIDYNEDGFQEKEIEDVAECSDFTDRSTVTWIKVEGFSNLDLLEQLCQQYALHPLVIEDILNTTQRPKIEDFGDYIFILLKKLEFSSEKGLTARQISIILSQNYVMSFEENHEDTFNVILNRIRLDTGKIRKMKSDYLAFSLLDILVENYFKVIEEVENQIESFENDVVDNPTSETLRGINTLKEQVTLLRKWIVPLREVSSRLERGRVTQITQPILVYFHDVYENVVQIAEAVDTFRDRIPVMLDIFFSSVSYRLNEVMKILTIVATIFIPLSLLAGVFGLNLYLPPLISISIIIAIFFLLVFFFWKKGWLK